MKKLLSLTMVLIVSITLSAQEDVNYYEQALNAYRAKDYNAAMQFIQQQCAIDCDLPTQWLAMEVLYKAGEYEYAGVMAENLLPKLKKGAKEDRATCLAYMGVAYFEMDDYKQAIKLMQKAQKENPTSTYIQYELGYFNAAIQKYNVAEKALLKSIELDSTYIQSYTLLGMVYQYKGDTAKMRAYYEKAIEMTEGKDAAVWCAYGYSYLELGDSIRAFDLLFEAIKADEKVYANTINGKYYTRLQRRCPNEQLRRIAEKNAEEPWNVMWETMLGDCYETMDSLDQGYRHYRIASLMDPTYDNGFAPIVRLAGALAKAEDYEGARQLVREALLANPVSLPHLRLEHLYTYQQGDWEKAFELADQLRKIDDDQKDDLTYMCAGYLYKLGRYEEAKNYVLELLKDNAGSTEITRLLADLHKQMGNTADAETNYVLVIREADKFYDYDNQKVIEINKDNRYNLGPFNLPRALMGIGRVDDAKEVVRIMNTKINNLLKEEPDAELKGELLYNLACVNAQVGMLSEAVDMLELAVKHGHKQALFMLVDPDFEPILNGDNADALLRFQEIHDRIAEEHAATAAHIHEVIDNITLTDEQRMRPN